MELEGTIHDGVAVPDGECPLPDGTKVRITSESQMPQPTIWDNLRKIAKKYEQLPCDLPADFSAEHDHYIHGTPKRQ